MSLGLISNNTERIDNLDALNEAAADRHKFVMEIRGSIVKKHREHQEQWDALQVRAVAPLSGADTMDWSPGPWLFSWEQNLPPNSQPRFFSMDSDGRKMWLFVGHEPEQDDSEEDELAPEQEWEEFEESEMLSLAKDMVACWPNSMAEVARTIGTTARDLKWALDGKTRLDQSALSKLLLMLSIEYGESGYYEAVGPCVLIARNIGAAARIYVELSRGGNLEASYEAVPESGEADPSWRYLVFHRDFGGASIIMFERGSQAGTRLNKKAFINFEGVRQVPNNLYRDVVATAARASRNPPANRLEMMGFMERHPDGGV